MNFKIAGLILGVIGFAMGADTTKVGGADKPSAVVTKTEAKQSGKDSEKLGKADDAGRLQKKAEKEERKKIRVERHAKFAKENDEAVEAMKKEMKAQREVGEAQSSRSIELKQEEAEAVEKNKATAGKKDGMSHGK